MSLNQALRADSVVCWLPTDIDQRPRAAGGRPAAARYVVAGSVAARPTDTALVVWQLIELTTSRQLVVDSVSLAEPDWARRVVRAIAEALARR
jgi:hypothetical protein